MSAWWTAFKLLLQYLPDIVSAIQRGEDWVELRIFLGKVDHGIEQAKSSKSTEELEKLLHDGASAKPDSATKH